MHHVLEDLVAMTRALGEPGADYVILGEGNTSASAGDGTFLVKGSGVQLREAGTDSFVRVDARPILAALDGPELDDVAIGALLRAATVEGSRSPSIETFLHALCLDLDGIRFVGHTHPTAALALLCGRRSRELFAGALFPDQVVVLGTTFAYVPYADPGLPLARAVRQALQETRSPERPAPRIVLMENHGVLALGASPREVLAATAMLVKYCRVLAGTFAAGGPRLLDPAQVERIDRRPDELARRRRLS